MNIDLTKIPYKHRTAAADLLTSKAQRLADLAGLHFEEIGDKEINKARQALSFYDMALNLMKPHDPNYQTILNWKCLTLIAIGQHKEALDWYQELVRIAHESEGPNCANATVDTAKKQIAELSGKENAPLPAIDDSEYRVLDDPAFCWWGEEFCELLQNKKYKLAHGCLSPELGNEISQAQLEEEWISLVSSDDAEVNIYLERYEIGSESDEKNYVGWCYFVIAGDDCNEAIAIDVYKTRGHGYEIRSIDFGRP